MEKIHADAPFVFAGRNRNDFRINKSNQTIVEIGKNTNFFPRRWYHFFCCASYFRNKVVKLINQQNIEHFPGLEKLRAIVGTKFDEMQNFCLKKLEKTENRIIATNLPEDLRNKTFYAQVIKFEDRAEVLYHMRNPKHWMHKVEGEEAISRLFPSRNRTGSLLKALWKTNDNTVELDRMVTIYRKQENVSSLAAASLPGANAPEVIGPNANGMPWIPVLQKAIQKPLEFMQQVGSHIAAGIHATLEKPMTDALTLFPQIEFLPGNLKKTQEQMYGLVDGSTRKFLGMDFNTVIEKGAALLKKFIVPFQSLNFTNPVNGLIRHLKRISPDAARMREAIVATGPVTGRMNLAEQKKPISEKLPTVFGPIVEELLAPALDPNGDPSELVLAVAKVLHTHLDNGVKIEGLPELKDGSPVINAVINIFATQALTAREEVKIARTMAAMDTGKRPERVKNSEIEKFLSPGSISFTTFTLLRTLNGPLGKILKVFRGLANGIANKLLKHKADPNWLQRKARAKIKETLETSLPGSLGTLFNNLGLIPYAHAIANFNATKTALNGPNPQFTWQTLFVHVSNINKIGSMFGIPPLAPLDLYTAAEGDNPSNEQRHTAAIAKVKAHLEAVSVQLCEGTTATEARYETLKRQEAFTDAEARAVEAFALALGVAGLPNDFAGLTQTKKKNLVQAMIRLTDNAVEDRKEAIKKMSHADNEQRKVALQTAIISLVVNAVTQVILPRVQILAEELELICALNNFVSEKDDRIDDLTPMLLPLLTTVEILADKYINGQPIGTELVPGEPEMVHVLTDGLSTVLAKLGPAIQAFMTANAEVK